MLTNLSSFSFISLRKNQYNGMQVLIGYNARQSSLIQIVTCQCDVFDVKRTMRSDIRTLHS